MSNLHRYFVPALLWLLISTILLTLPGSTLPKNDWFSKVQFDKWVHIGMFCLMVVLFCWSFYKKGLRIENRKTTFILTGIICLVYGIAMEFVQDNFIPNRGFDVGDIIADAVGSAIGVIYSIKRYIKK